MNVLSIAKMTYNSLIYVQLTNDNLLTKNIAYRLVSNISFIQGTFRENEKHHQKFPEMKYKNNVIQRLSVLNKSGEQL